MSAALDMARLINVHQVGGKTIAQCPACAKSGEDEAGEHLVIQADGKFGCILHPGSEGAEHRRRIFALAGTNDKSTSRTPQSKTAKIHPTLDAAAKAAAWAVGQQKGHEWRETRRDMYQDADGHEVAAVLRFERIDGTTDSDGKAIKSFRPVHAVPGGWKLGDPPGLWPLFNLPKVMESTGPVFVCEGEKAASAGIANGLNCTTSAHGAKAAGKTDFRPLKDRDVIFLPDRDKAGRGYAKTAAKRAHAAGAKSVKILELPGLPAKGDLADYVMLRSGQSPETIRAEIERLAASAPVWAPPADDDEGTEPDHNDDTIIVLPGGRVSITQSADNIFRRIAPSHELFIRGGSVMELREDDNGVLRLDILRAQSFRSRIEKLGMLVAWRVGSDSSPVLKPVICPTDTAEGILACQPAAALLPKVRGLTACPVLVEVDGNVLVLAKGYHAANGGLLVTAGKTPPEMKIAEAIEVLRLLVADFDFSTPSDRSRALASFITPALRLGGWLCSHIPIDVAEADKSQSGKTYRQKLVFAAYAEEPYRIALRDGGVGGLDESIQQALITGRPFIQIDNVRGRLDSQYIEMMTTAGGTVGARVPHRSEVLIDARHFLLMITSNGVETTRDLANRSSIVRIRKRANHAFRTFPEGDLLDHVKANQSRFLGAIFAVIRAWYVAGKPKTTDTRHSFSEWGQVLDWIVRNILGEAPLMDGHEQAQERVSNPALTWLRRVALAIESDQRLDEEIMAASIGEVCEDHSIEIPGLREAGDEGSRNKRVGVLMKKAFGDEELIEIDRFRVRRTEKEHYYQAEQQYKMLRAYVFSIQLPEQPEPPEQPSELPKNTPHFTESYTPSSGGSGNSSPPSVEDEERIAIQSEGSLDDL